MSRTVPFSSIACEKSAFNPITLVSTRGVKCFMRLRHDVNHVDTSRGVWNVGDGLALVDRGAPTDSTPGSCRSEDLDSDPPTNRMHSFPVRGADICDIFTPRLHPGTPTSKLATCLGISSFQYPWHTTTVLSQAEKPRDIDRNARSVESTLNYRSRGAALNRSDGGITDPITPCGQCIPHPRYV